MKKTIKELNEKMWYRALKVAYLVTSIILLVVITGEIISDAPRYIANSKNNRIMCDNGKSFLATDINLPSNYRDLSQVTRPEAMKINDACEGKKLKTDLEYYKLVGINYNAFDGKDYSVEEKFHIFWAHKLSKGYGKYVLDSLLLCGAMFLGIFFVRASFFYILIGHLFPNYKKKL